MEKAVEKIAEGLNQREEASVKVLCCQAKGTTLREKINGVEITRASSAGIFLGMPISFSFFRLFKAMSAECDLLVFHQPFPLSDIALFLYRPRVSVVIHYHSDIIKKGLFYILAKPFIIHSLKKAKKIIISSRNLLFSSPCLKNFQEKCEVVPFGVDIEQFSPRIGEEADNVKERYGDNIILFVGRLVHYKGLEYLLTAMKQASGNLIIAGDGILKSALEKQARDLGLKNRVFFISGASQEELIALYRSARVFVLPSVSKNEAFGIVLIEAMACGLPIISTELGTGTSFVNKDNITGFVVPPRNATALTFAIKKIVDHPVLGQELGRKARQRAIEFFSLGTMLKNIAAIYYDSAKDKSII